MQVVALVETDGLFGQELRGARQVAVREQGMLAVPPRAAPPAAGREGNVRPCRTTGAPKRRIQDTNSRQL
jgi:hypothetical protein